MHVNYFVVDRFVVWRYGLTRTQSMMTEEV